MNHGPPRPMCFVAMPFGKKAPLGKKKPVIDFDTIYGSIERGDREDKRGTARHSA